MAIGLKEDLGGAIIGFVFSLLVAGFFVALGVFAKKGEGWAFIVGFVIYAFDGLIFLFVQEWFGLAFHVFVLFCLYRGWSANNKWKESLVAVAA